FEPGAELPFHFHNCEESVLLLAGEAIAEIDGTEYSLIPGDVSFIPAGVPHRFRNPSTETRMKIMWTYASIEADRTIVATGDTRKIAEEHERIAWGLGVSGRCARLPISGH
ncbi:cupin domain-containing protein, partial [Sphingomonas sp.]|uniref:cupin domain-containing protein n=1 Tax=Sphingomonas sp. TaxID=28214 RepID=UPI0025D981EB